MWVYGALECGTIDSPFQGSLDITIYGPKPVAGTEQADRVGGDKAIAVFSGGKLDLHGAKLSTWTCLTVQASSGDSFITVEDAIDWQVGDSILIVSTSPYFHGVDNSASVQHESRQIVSIHGILFLSLLLEICY